MNIYSCMDAAIVLYMWLVAAVCLYILTLLAYDRVMEKCFLSPGKSWNSRGICCNQESGQPVLMPLMS